MAGIGAVVKCLEKRLRIGDQAGVLNVELSRCVCNIGRIHYN